MDEVEFVGEKLGVQQGEANSHAVLLDMIVQLAEEKRNGSREGEGGAAVSLSGVDRETRRYLHRLAEQFRLFSHSTGEGEPRTIHISASPPVGRNP
jgi:hypothetical protein